MLMITHCFCTLQFFSSHGRQVSERLLRTFFPSRYFLVLTRGVEYRQDVLVLARVVGFGTSKQSKRRKERILQFGTLSNDPTRMVALPILLAAKKVLTVQCVLQSTTARRAPTLVCEVPSSRRRSNSLTAFTLTH
jgi:hypothetical protein